MLTHLHIENYAIIEHLDIDLASGLNTITGETGAGKSILLGALALLAGGKGDSAAIGVNGDSCVVEGNFKIEGYKLDDIFAKFELDLAPEIDIRRVVSKTGKSRAFVGDVPVSLSAVREIVDRLVDIHSQHQTLLLAREDFQREIVDAVAQNGSKLEKYQAIYADLQKASKSLGSLQSAQKDSLARGEFLSFQIDQLRAANIQVSEQAAVEAELRELTYAEDIGIALSYCSEAMQNDEQGALLEIKGVIHSLTKIIDNFSKAEALIERLDSCYIELKDITAEIDDALDNVEVNPRRLELLQSRIDTIYTMCKKHNVGSGDELCDVLAEAESEYDLLENSTENMERLEAQIAKLREQAILCAAELTRSRIAAAPKIEKHIIDSLKKLGIKNPRLEVQIGAAELSLSGADNVKFMFSANDGAAMQQIENAASGGEMSRLMLSIKALVAKQLQLPTIIFDEIDTGVSGAVADAMGEIIYGLSLSMQVINITHLPQVASKGEHHFQVYKDKGTHIRKLTASERVEQIAAMISGSTVTAAAMEQAQVLLKGRN